MSQPLLKLEENNKKLNTEVVKLAALDFQMTFEKIEGNFINKFNFDTQRKLEILDKKTQDLQIKINELSIQITRLDKIDLESQSKKLLNSLTTEMNKQQNEQNLKFEGLKSQNETLIARIGQQEKENKNLKGIFLLSVLVIFILLVLNLVIR